MVVVVADDGVVLGLVPTEALGQDPSAPVEDLMSSGPSTFRPSVPCRELASYLAEKDEAHALVTTLDGALVGLASGEDLDACAGTAGGDTP
jgi:Mg/Co/Ni transporter MgtE